VVICLERGADCLHMIQLMLLHPKTPSSVAAFKSRNLRLPFWYWLGSSCSPVYCRNIMMHVQPVVWPFLVVSALRFLQCFYNVGRMTEIASSP